MVASRGARGARPDRAGEAQQASRDTDKETALGSLHAALRYFVAVFGIGFLFGPPRVLWLEPRVGARTAELLEAPIMGLAVYLVARWLVRHRLRHFDTRHLLFTGLWAAGFVLLADVAVGVGLRGQSLAGVFVDRDPVTGAVYHALVAGMALAPWLIRRFAIRRR